MKCKNTVAEEIAEILVEAIIEKEQIQTKQPVKKMKKHLAFQDKWSDNCKKKGVKGI